MDKSRFYGELEELLELSSGSLRGDRTLDKLPNWDSLAVIRFIALADSEYGVILQPKRIEACQTVDDLAQLIDGNHSSN